MQPLVETVPVSVVIPAYNRADMVAAAVRSVMSQVPAPAEVLVIDDASSDDTAAEAERAGARVLVLPQNRGEGGARSAGVHAAQFDWVAFLDSDDHWLPGHLALLWEHHEGHVLVATSGICDPSGRHFGNPGGDPLVLRSPADMFWPDNPVNPSGALAARGPLILAGCFPDRGFAADLAAWVGLLEHGTAVVLPEVGWVYREHEGQVSLDRRGMYASTAALLEEHANRPWATSSLRRRVAVQQAWDRLRAATTAGDRSEQLQSVRRLATNPSTVIALPVLWSRRRAKRRRMVTG